MEQVDNQLQRLLTQAAQFRKLASDYAAAEHEPIAAKLYEVAAEFEAKAAGLERERRSVSPSLTFAGERVVWDRRSGSQTWE